MKKILVYDARLETLAVEMLVQGGAAITWCRIEQLLIGLLAKTVRDKG